MTAAKAEPFWSAFFACLYYLGLRLNEARTLTPSSFDFKRKAVRVLQKGGAWKILPLVPDVTTPIRRLIGMRSCGPDDFLFVTRFARGGKPVVNVREAVARICKAAGVRKRVYPHLFRHSLASHMVENNENIVTIQRMLGHKFLTTTTFYAQSNFDALRSAQARVSTKKRVKSA